MEAQAFLLSSLYLGPPQGGGGSIFWKTRDIGLPSFSNNLSTAPSHLFLSNYLCIAGTCSPTLVSRALIFKLLRSPRIDSSLCSLAGWYDNSIPTRFLAPEDCLKIHALSTLRRL
jgi:hypothetical protein